MKISKLSIGALLDFGYHEVNPGTSEGALIIDSSSSKVRLSNAAITPVSTSLKFHNCHNRNGHVPICEGKIIL